MPQRIVNLRVLIDADDEFDIQNLGVVITELNKNRIPDPITGKVDDFLYLPRTKYCEIVEYLRIEEEPADDYNF